MLSRTADSLFWMARYIERAENTARLLDVQRQAVLLPSTSVTEGANYAQTLLSLVADPENPSSIVSCLSAARENCRIVRGAINTEVWETVNATWLEMQTMLQDDQWRRDATNLFDWVKHRSHLFRGIMIGTMLKDEAFHFMRLGTFIERADSTARILDARFAMSQPQTGKSGHPSGPIEDPSDYYYWASVLRSVSALETYRRVYRDAITPRRVAALLIQRPDMPRSLLACLNEVCANLSAVCSEPGGETERIAGRLRADLQYLRIDDQFESQIHDFLTHFLAQMYALGVRVSYDYLGGAPR